MSLRPRSRQRSLASEWLNRAKRGVVAFAGVCLLALIMTSSQPAWGAFPGLNGKIAFSALRGDSSYQVYVMNADGTGLTKLVSTANDIGPSWSADGTKIVFKSFAWGSYGEIYVMDADGSDRTRLTFTAADEEIPAWSPDGTKIVFTRWDAVAGYDIFVINADGTGEAQLTTNPAADAHAVWSPDGTKIAFLSTRDGAGEEIYVMNANGTNQTRLTNNTSGDDNPDWSPDGTKIAFASMREGSSEIFVMNANGTNQTRLSPGFSCDAPAWSPDGTKIACSAPGYGSAIWVMDADGTDQTQLTNGWLDNSPDWQPLDAAYDFLGFFQPVDNLPTVNSLKAGAAVPVKFSLHGFQGLGIFAAGYPKSELIACDSTGEPDGIEETVTAGSSSLSYDAALDQYTYVWKTSKAWSNTCRQLIVKLSDGTFHRANFKLK